MLTQTVIEDKDFDEIDYADVAISGISGALSGLSNNGKGTPGHIRIPEAEQMSDELVAFINRLGEKIWK